MSEKPTQDVERNLDLSTEDGWYYRRESPRWMLELSDDEVNRLHKYVESEDFKSFCRRLCENLR